MRYIYIYICLSFFKWSFGQIRFNIEDKIGIDTTMDIGVNVIELKNHNFLSCGVSNSLFNPSRAAYLVKIKDNGDTLWRKQFNFSGRGLNAFTDLKELPDSNYLLVGTVYDTLIQNNDVFLAKIDTGGTLIWIKKYIHIDNDESNTIKITPDNKVIIIGNSSPNPNTTYNDVLLIKTDINGNLIWRKRFGDIYEEQYFTIEILKNNTEYVLGGMHGYYITGDPYFDMSIMRTDTAGNIIWQQQYGTAADETAGCAIQTLDSGFVLSGTYNSSGALLKLDKSGNQKWIKNYGFPADSYIRCVKQLPDSSFAFITSYTYAPTNSFTGFLNKTDKNGNLLWQRVYPGPTTIPNYFFGFNTTSDKGFIMTGQYNHIGQPYQNMWLVKTDSLGCDSVTCSYLVTDVKDISYELREMSFAPNPSNGLLTISSLNDFTKIDLLSLTGQTLLSESINSKTHQLNLTNFAEGIYFVRVSYEDGRRLTKKIIKQ